MLKVIRNQDYKYEEFKALFSGLPAFTKFRHAFPYELNDLDDEEKFIKAVEAGEVAALEMVESIMSEPSYFYYIDDDTAYYVDEDGCNPDRLSCWENYMIVDIMEVPTSEPTVESIVAGFPGVLTEEQKNYLETAYSQILLTGKVEGIDWSSSSLYC